MNVKIKHSYKSDCWQTVVSSSGISSTAFLVVGDFHVILIGGLVDRCRVFWSP